MKRYIIDMVLKNQEFSLENLVAGSVFAGNKRGARTQAEKQYPNYKIHDIWEWKFPED